MQRAYLRRAVRSIIAGVLVIGCSSGTDSSATGPGGSAGNPPGQTGTTTKASCTITATGALTATHTCQAIVAYYEGKMSVAIVDTQDDQSRIEFNFAVAISSQHSLSPGTYDSSSAEQLAGYAKQDDDDAGLRTWTSAAQNGNDVRGALKLTITSVGAEKNMYYGGTVGTIDATLPDTAGSAPDVRAHVSFVSIGT